MLVVLGGPTGAGKTALSLDLAEAIAARGGAAEIVNADAMQLYRGMDIGTAKLPPGQRRGVPHHCLDIWPVTETASVAVYRDAARAAIAEIEERGAIPLLVGGSGLYIEAVTRDLRFAPTDAELRSDLEREAEALGPDALWRRLAEQDPVAAARIPSGNLRRVIRALEVVTLTGEPYAASLPDQAASWRPTIRVVVEAESRVLADRLETRAARMWSDGLLDEVRGLLTEGLADGVTAARAVGYSQAIAVLARRMTLQEGLADTVRMTWRVVRRQRSWFGRDEALAVQGGDPSAVPTVLAALEDEAGGDALR